MSKQIGTLQDFADWAGTMPADGRYDYECTDGCAIFQYVKSRGLPVRRVAGDYWSDTDHRTHPMPDGAAINHVAARSPWTFGAARQRALDALEGGS